KNSIERGSRDTWTITPQRVAEAEAVLAKERPQSRERGLSADAAVSADEPDRPGRERGLPLKYYEMLHRPEDRDPRGFIIPADQPDFPTATKFINALIKTGITVYVAKSEFQVGGRKYPAGSFVVKTAQAFRPHVMDMFEPQDHPNDFRYPGGPPIPPYDNAGWTLAYQMGVRFDRILDGFDGPFEKLSGFAKPPAGHVNTTPQAAGYLLSHEVNDSFIATNRLLKDNDEVYWIKQPFNANGKSFPAGTIFIPVKASLAPKLQKLAEEFGLNFEAIAKKPAGDLYKLRPLRVGLWDRYCGSIPSGWTRWLLERFEFPFTVVYPKTLDGEDLASKFDVLIFVDGAIPLRESRGPGEGGGGFGCMQPSPDDLPEEYRGWLGSVTLSKTVPAIKKFLEAGGTVLTIGSSTNLGYHAGLPITNALIERTGEGVERPLSREKYYIPGSLLQVSVDNTNPLAYGMPEKVDVFFDNSPVFHLKPEAGLKGVNPVAWFAGDKPLRSGWAWGQKYLEDGVAVIDASVGKGKLLMFGPEIAYRAQPHGTFKFLFNGIYYGRAELVKW
ncbi:MAG: peptidase, partial [Blastocatellia bacterium]|nr:peptidase [Blastocatellia bacterium]